MLRKFRNVLPDYAKVLARGTVAPLVRKGCVTVRDKKLQGRSKCKG